MRSHILVVAFCCRLAALNCLSVPTARPYAGPSRLHDLPVKPRQSLDLLAKKSVLKKWNWKEASDESRTEWGIVLKRYILIDMSLYELGRHLGESLPVKPSTGGEKALVDEDALKMAQVKLERVQSNLQKALLDQNTSDTTTEDMQKERKGNELTVHQKRILRDEHKREQSGFFAVEASGQDVLQQASAIMQALEVWSQKAQPSWRSIVPALVPKSAYASIFPKMRGPTGPLHNGTVGELVPSHQSTTKQAAPSVQSLYQKFQEAARNYHRDLGNFEAMQKQAITNFLSLTNLLAVSNA